MGTIATELLVPSQPYGYGATTMNQKACASKSIFQHHCRVAALPNWSRAEVSRDGCKSILL